MNFVTRSGALAAAIGAFAVSHGSIVGITGGVVNLDADPGSFDFLSVDDGANQSDTNIWAFTERANVLLPSALKVNVDAPGSYYSTASLPHPEPTLAMGTAVDSVMLYTDPKHSPKFFEGTVTFNTPILGVILGSETLESSDSILGRPGTSYPHNDDGRGLELGDGMGVRGFPGEGISWSGETITFDAKTYGNVDEVRVLTAAVPEPASVATLGIGLIGLVRRRLRA